MAGLLERLRGLVAHNSAAASAVVKLGPFGSYNAFAWSHARLTKSVYGNPTGYRCIEIIINQFCRPEFEVRKPGTEEPIEAHKMLDVLNHPEPTRSGTSMQRTWAMDLELNGRSFWVFMQGRDGLGNAGPVTGLKRLIPQRTTVVANLEDELLGFVYQPRAGGRVALLPEQVLYLRYPHPEREFDGMPPAMVAGMAAELDGGAVRFNADLLANDAGMPGYLVVEGLNRNVFTEWKAAWDAGENPGKIRFLGSPGSGGKVTFVKTALSNQELTYHELRGDAQSDICATFGVPHVLIDPTDATFSNMDAAMLALWRYTVLPKWTIVADDSTIQMGLAAGVEIGVDLSKIEELQEGEDAKVQRLQTLLQLDAMTINEWRADEGSDPLPWGDYSLSFLRQLTAPVVAGVRADLPTEILEGMGGGEVNPRAPAMQKLLAQRRREMRTIAQAMPSAFAALTKAHEPRQRVPRPLGQKAAPEPGASPMRTKDGRQAYYQRWDRRVRAQEGLVSRKMARFFERQRGVVVAKLRSSGAKSLTKTLASTAWWDPTRWNKELKDDVAIWVSDTIDTFGSATADDLEAAGFDPTDPEIQDYIDTEAERISTQINDGTYDALTAAIEGLGEGAKIADVVDTVDSWFSGIMDARPDLIAEIEVIPAANAGSQFAAEQSGDSLTKMWVTAGDEQVDEECAEYDGVEIGLDEDWGAGAEPGDLHFGCLVGETVVELPSPALWVSQRKYVGDVVSIKLASGNDLTGTPNHPVATWRGWVPLAELRLGDHVFHGPGQERGPSLLSPDEHHVPATFEQIAQSLPVALPHVPTAAQDFHGDGAGSDVHVVRANGFLHDRGESFSLKGLAERPGCWRYVKIVDAGVGFPGAGHTTPFLQRVAASLSSGVGCGREDYPLFRRRLGHADDHRLATTAGGDPLLAEHAHDHGSGDAQPVGQRLDTLPVQEGRHQRSPNFDARLPFDRHLGHAELAPNLVDQRQADAEGFCERLGALDGITASEVVRVDRGPFAGQVYNLETVDGWYCGNGIVTHNCRCTAVYLKITPQGDEEETGDSSDSGDGGDVGAKGAPSFRRKFNQIHNTDGRFGESDTQPVYASKKALKAARTLAVQTAQVAHVPTEAERQAHAERVARSGRSGGDDRGNNTDRARRSVFLVNKFGDGQQCPCVHCGRMVTTDTVTADRIYPGSAGGRYVQGNVVPACDHCNSSRQDADFFAIAQTWGVKS